MSHPESRVPATFREFVRNIDHIDDVLEAALILDRVFCPESDPREVRERIDELAMGYADRISATFDLESRFEELGRFLGEHLGFRGDRTDFANPNNSFINKVLQRRRGLPITLSILYVAVAARAGVPVSGIGLPGHFIVGQLRTSPPSFLDPFRGGRAFPREACDRIVTEVTNGDVTSAERYLSPTTPRAFLTRMLNNLQMVYWHRREDHLGLRAARMLCVLNPGAADSVKARAYFYDRLGDANAALIDYDAYVRRDPESVDSRRLQQRITYLRAALGETGPRT